MKKKILHLTLKKKWFDLIAQGKKKEEYREIKPYWYSRFTRIINEGHRYTTQFIGFDEIHFTNGYGKNKPFMRVKFKGYRIEDNNDKGIYVLRLGKILEIKNYRGATNA